MSYFKQNKTTLWILLAVVLFNIAAIVTIYYKMSYPDCNTSCKKEKRCMQTYLKKELNLNATQSEKFDIEKARYQDTVIKVHALMMAKREIVSAEMTKANADTLLLYNTSDELGVLYAQTRKLYINHYFELSKICTEEQRKKLASIIGNVFCCEGRKNDLGLDRKHKKHNQSCQPDNRGKF